MCERFPQQSAAVISKDSKDGHTGTRAHETCDVPVAYASRSMGRTMGWQRSFTLTPEDMGNRTFSCITWSPNGKSLAVGYTDGTIQLFGVETGEWSGGAHVSVPSTVTYIESRK